MNKSSSFKTPFFDYINELYMSLCMKSFNLLKIITNFKETCQLDLSSKVEAGLKDLAMRLSTDHSLCTGQWVLSWRRSAWHIFKPATILPMCHTSPLTHKPLGSPHPEFECPCFNEGTFRRRMLMWIKYSPFTAVSLRSSQKCNLLLEYQALPRISTLSLPWAF